MTTTPEAYVFFSEDQKTLTFFYDTLRADCDGTVWRIRVQRTITIGLLIWYIPVPSFSRQSLMLRSVIFVPPPRQDGLKVSDRLKVSKVLKPQHLAGDGYEPDVRRLPIFEGARPIQL